MTKTLLAASTLTFLLCAPALANPQPAPAPAPARAPVAAASVTLSIVVASAGAVRTYDLVIGEHGCGTVQEKTAAYEDELRVCSVVATNGLRLELDAATRARGTEYRSRAEMVLARKGATAQIGRAGGVRFTVKTL